MRPVTEFFSSQIGGESVINYAYTDLPWKLLAKDVYFFFVYSWALPWVLWPLWPFASAHLDELYPSARNLFCLAVHLLLIAIQLTFLLLLPCILVFPAWISIAGISVFLAINWLLCFSLNGTELTYESDEEYAESRPEHAHEKWVYLNGVSVGKHWMKSNLNRLALTFGRPVLGIHNKTSGLVFDIIECLVQRNLGYATTDVRVCYKILKDILYDPGKSKVIFILHSQGAIEGSMVLDWLLQEMPQDLLCKLEVYTFGNAANHFNNPHRHALSQALSSQRPSKAFRTIVTETSFEGPVASPVASPIEDDKQLESPSPLHTTTTHVSAVSSFQTTYAAKDRAIGHIEHYAHSTDFVAVWGILHFATNKMASPQLPRFLGRLFNRSSRRGGHLFVQHYLDSMFPLARDRDSGEFVGADEDNDFMEEVIKFGEEGTAMDNAREAFEISYGGTGGFGTGDITTPVEVYDRFDARRRAKKGVKVKELSRLWLYRNGLSPPFSGPPWVTELGVLRTETL
ncbi:hypothetical protein ESCO_002736 [Escovopsis weberi]|uniref:Uncharacterized protein n=1 Tax=Escovopsis weberi TaxID=150374 RepID=A0A0M8N0M8_ESCWE|nr:hypothetical protein ESCO_002736 [Escovopsis weberi]